MLKFFFELDGRNFKDTTIIVDLDGTLTQDGKDTIDEKTAALISLLKKNNRIYLFSNKRNEFRCSALARALGIDYLQTRYKKPNKKVLASLPPHLRRHLVIIGDKFLTDGLLAKQSGAQFIKVKRMTSPKDSLLTKLIYSIDDIASLIFSNFL